MNIIIDQMPDISKYSKVYKEIQLDENNTVLVCLKYMYRDDGVLIDIYKNEITLDNKIVSGKVLVKDSLLYAPNGNDFYYYIDCVDIDGIGGKITNKNLKKFYLQFSNYTNEEI